VLYLHELHQVVGGREEEHAAAYREGWMPLLARDDDARLLWYLTLAPGAGPSYTVVTWTAVRDGAAWERLARRMVDGDLAAWAREVDPLRRDARASLLLPLPWSPMRDADLAEVPVAGVDHDPVLYLEDTAWPHAGRLEEYVERSGTLYYEETVRRSLEQGIGLLDVVGAFRPALGAGRWREVVLLQRIVRPDLLPWLFAVEIPEEHRRPGTWMHDALALRDRWRSRILRSARWSPFG
jgi:hypothetical protein